MPQDAPGDRRLSRLDDFQPDVATFLVARAMAEVYRNALDEPIPAPVVAVLRQIEAWGTEHGPDAA